MNTNLKAETAIIVKGVAPNAADLEQVVLSAVMTDRNAADTAIYMISELAFYEQRNKCLYNACKSLYNRSLPIDMLTVMEEIKRAAQTDICPAHYIVEVSGRMAGSANIEHHCRILLQKQIARGIVHVGIESVTNAMSEQHDAFELLDKTERDIYAVGHQIQSNEAVKIGDGLPEILRRIEAATKQQGITGLPGGINQFDKHTGGFQPGELYVLAGRPGMGKTALLLSWAMNISKSGVPAGVFSLEMTRDELTMRLLSAFSGISSASMKKGFLNDADWQPLSNAANEAAGIPLYIDDEGALSASALRSRARRMVQRLNVRIIFVDYLQKMAAPKEYKGQREAEVNFNIQSLKNIAKELKIPVVVLSQLSRAVESRADKRPQLSDLRESGAIEQEADMVVFMWRPGYYQIEQDESGAVFPHGYVELDIAKFRHGATMAIPVQFVAEQTLITDISRDQAFFGGKTPNGQPDTSSNSLDNTPVFSPAITPVGRVDLDQEIPF